MEIPKYIIKIVLDVNKSQERQSASRLERKVESEFYIINNELPVVKDGFVRVDLSVFNKDKILYYRVYTNVEEIAKRWFYRCNPSSMEFVMDYKSFDSETIMMMIEGYED